MTGASRPAGGWNGARDCTRGLLPTCRPPHVFHFGTTSPPFWPALLRRASSFWAASRSGSLPTRTRNSLCPFLVASESVGLKPCERSVAARWAALSRLLKVPTCTVQPAGPCSAAACSVGACGAVRAAAAGGDGGCAGGSLALTAAVGAEAGADA